MALADSLAARKPVLVQAQDQAVTDFGTGMYNDGLADQKAADGSQTSPADAQQIADLQKQVADLTAKDASDVAALSDAQGKLSALQSQFDDLSKKESSEASVISGLQGSLSQLQNVVSILQGVLNPQPQPAPVPAPVPAPAPAPQA